MDILCSDKTGTLTQNRLSIRQFVPYGGQTTETLLQNAVLASDQTEKDDAIDQLIKQTWHMHFPDSDVLNAYSQTKYIPFDPVNKRTEATYTHNGNIIDCDKRCTPGHYRPSGRCTGAKIHHRQCLVFCRKRLQNTSVS